MGETVFSQVKLQVDGSGCSHRGALLPVRRVSVSAAGLLFATLLLPLAV